MIANDLKQDNIIFLGGLSARNQPMFQYETGYWAIILFDYGVNSYFYNRI